MYYNYLFCAFRKLSNNLILTSELHHSTRNTCIDIAFARDIVSLSPHNPLRAITLPMMHLAYQSINLIVN